MSKFAVSVQKNGDHIGYMAWMYSELTKDLNRASVFDSRDDAQWHIDVIKDKPNEFGGAELVITPIVETVTKSRKVLT